jgi:hypothetical protein
MKELGINPFSIEKTDNQIKATRNPNMIIVEDKEQQNHFMNKYSTLRAAWEKSNAGHNRIIRYNLNLYLPHEAHPNESLIIEPKNNELTPLSPIDLILKSIAKNFNLSASDKIQLIAAKEGDPDVKQIEFSNFFFVPKQSYRLKVLDDGHYLTLNLEVRINDHKVNNLPANKGPAL